MSFNTSSYERKIYDVLTLLGDIGGVQGAFETIFTWLTCGWAALALESLLVSQLFQVKKGSKVKTPKHNPFSDG